MKLFVEKADSVLQVQNNPNGHLTFIVSTVILQADKNKGYEKKEYVPTGCPERRWW